VGRRLHENQEKKMSQERGKRRETGSNEVEIVEFKLGNQSFGINVSKVREFVPHDPEAITTLPQAPPSMVGVFVLRGSTIPLIDLNNFLSRPQEESSGKQVVIVTQFNQRAMGFITDGINKIHRLSWDSFQPMHEYLGGFGPQIIGSVNVDDQEILVLDLEYVVGEVDPGTLTIYDEADEPPPPEGSDRGEVKLVLVDDSSVIRDHLVKKLNKVGYSDISVYANGKEALDAIKAKLNQAQQSGKNWKELMSGVVTDIEMPAMDGLTLCRNIKENLGLKDLPVVMFSSLVNQDVARRCQAAGADAYTKKPGAADLLELMDKFLLPQAGA
jgi:two-component system chemotaxis response regulator CheV